MQNRKLNSIENYGLENNNTAWLVGVMEYCGAIPFSKAFCEKKIKKLLFLLKNLMFMTIFAVGNLFKE